MMKNKWFWIGMMVFLLLILGDPLAILMTSMSLTIIMCTVTLGYLVSALLKRRFQVKVFLILLTVTFVAVSALVITLSQLNLLN